MKLLDTLMSKFKYEFVWFLILALYMLYYLPMPSEMHRFCVAPYVLRYDMGFISRGFIGSFWGMLFPFISRNKIWVIIGLNQLILCIAVTIFLGVIRKYSQDNTRKGLVYLIVLFLINPASISFLFYWGNYGRMDLFMILGTIFCGVFIVKEKFLWAIPVVCALEMAIHQGFVFSYFPCILTLLLYMVLMRKKYAGIFIVTFFVGCASFLYFQFFGKIDTMTLEETLALMMSRTNLPESDLSVMVEMEYYMSLFEFISGWVLPLLKENIIKIVLVIILLLPLEIVLFVIWKKFVDISKNKLFWSMPAFIIIATLPKFIITWDYGRDISSILISVFVLIFVLFTMPDNYMQRALEEFQNWITQRPFFACSAICLLSAIGKFEAANILDITDNIHSVLSILF